MTAPFYCPEFDAAGLVVARDGCFLAVYALVQIDFFADFFLFSVYAVVSDPLLHGRLGAGIPSRGLSSTCRRRVDGSSVDAGSGNPGRAAHDWPCGGFERGQRDIHNRDL